MTSPATIVPALLEPSAMTDLSDPERETVAAAEGTGSSFGHHPEVDFDFCIEVEDLTGYAYEVRTGLNFAPGRRSQWPFWSRLSRALRYARTDVSRLDGQSRAAIPLLRSLEAYALRKDDMPITSLPALTLSTKEPRP